MVAEVSKILLTGATGYIGGRLLTALQESGRTVRCLARNPDFLRSRVDSEIEVVQGDCLQPSSLRGCFDGVETAYYLIHSMGSAKDFEAQDRAAATHFGQAAREAGVARIVYVGGLGSGGGGRNDQGQAEPAWPLSGSLPRRVGSTVVYGSQQQVAGRGCRRHLAAGRGDQEDRTR